MPTTPKAPHPHHSPPTSQHQQTHPTINYAAFSNLGFSVVEILRKARPSELSPEPVTRRELPQSLTKSVRSLIDPRHLVLVTHVPALQ